MKIEKINFKSIKILKDQTVNSLLKHFSYVTFISTIFVSATKIRLTR